MDKDSIEKLKKWVNEHPTEANAKHAIISTGKIFTIKEILDQIIQEDELKIAIVDEETIQIKTDITTWIGGM